MCVDLFPGHFRNNFHNKPVIAIENINRQKVVYLRNDDAYRTGFRRLIRKFVMEPDKFLHKGQCSDLVVLANHADAMALILPDFGDIRHMHIQARA